MASVTGNNAALVNKVAVVKPSDGQNQRKDIKTLLTDINIKKRFEEVLGKSAPAFISSLISVTNGNRQLKQISVNNPMSIISAGAIAAALNLPIDPNLGFAYIIPYGDKATFQMGYKGFIQLAMRTGQYRTINACEVYSGEIKSINRFTGEIEFSEKESEEIIGYLAYFRLSNGFEKYLYMSKQEVEEHGKSYSKSYNNKDGRWKKDFHAMAIKTVIKRLLSKYGILSIEMQSSMGTALIADQAVIGQNDTGDAMYDYIDGVDGDTIDAEYTTVEQITDEISASKAEDVSDQKQPPEREESLSEKHKRMTWWLDKSGEED